MSDLLPSSRPSSVPPGTVNVGITMVGRGMNGVNGINGAHAVNGVAAHIAPGDVLPVAGALALPPTSKPLLGGLTLPPPAIPQDLVSQAMSSMASQEALTAALAATKENSPTMGSLASATGAAVLPLPPSGSLLGPAAPGSGVAGGISQLQAAAAAPPMNSTTSPVLAPAAGSGIASDLPQLPEPEELVLVNSTTTSLHIKWKPCEGLEGAPYVMNCYWFVEFCKVDDTEILGNSSFPLKVYEAPVTALQPSCEYKIRLRLEVRHLPTAGPTLSSSWTAGVFRTLDVAGMPPAPPRPVVHRLSSTLSEVTILAAPCMTGEEYFCAESYLLQRIDGAVPEDDAREDEWKSVPEVTCSCTHPKVPEIVPSLEKKRVPLAADKTYHFRVRATNRFGSSAWSEIASILPTPASPEVRVEQVKSLSATLVWSPPEDHGFPILHYHVFLCRSDDESDMKEAVVLPASQAPGSEGAGAAGREGKEGKEEEGEGAPLLVHYHAQQLQPNSCYKFFVRARTEGGLSDPSPQCDVVTQPLPPPMPVSVGIDQIEPDALHFTWSLREEAERNATSVCEVMWRELSKEEAEEAAREGAGWSMDREGVEKDKVSAKEIPCGDEVGGDYSCKIIGLMADTLYAVQVRGKNGGGEGPWSPAVMQRTTVPPPQQPTTLYSSDSTSTSTTLSWDHPLDDAFPVTAYQIKTFRSSGEEMREATDGWQTIAAEETGDSRLCYTVENLEPGQEYSFQVRAMNQLGPGDETDLLKVSTKCDVPPPPLQPEQLDSTPHSIVLTWSPPARDNGSEVTAYSLQMRRHGGEEWRMVSDEITSVPVEVDCPEPRTGYLFRVRARNALGNSEWGDESMFETLPPPPPVPPQGLSVVSSHNSATMHWPHQEATVTGYEVQQRKNGEWISVVEAEQQVAEQLGKLKRERKHSLSDTEVERPRKRHILFFTRENLSAGTEYVFRVAAKNAGGHAFSEELAVQTAAEDAGSLLSEEEQERLRALFRYHACSEYYERFAAALYDVETLSRLTQEELRVVLERLHVLPRHRELIRRALSQPPGAPERLAKATVTSDSITLQWAAPALSGYPVVDYVVGFHSRDSQGAESPWEEVRCGATCCKVEGLMPAMEYCFRVAACNEPQGQGPWSEKVVLHTLDAECGDTELCEALRAVLNTQEYADKVAGQLYHDQWTLPALRHLPRDKLEEMLRRMRVKEGAVHAISQALTQE